MLKVQRGVLMLAGMIIGPGMFKVQRGVRRLAGMFVLPRCA